MIAADQRTIGQTPNQRCYKPLFGEKGKTPSNRQNAEHSVIYGKNDKPTNGEFIALVADKLLMEEQSREKAV